MSKSTKPITILYADDDPEDRMLVKEAWEESHVANVMAFVEDGEELMDYLLRQGKYTALADAPLPGLILLDLNMPKKDGREALKEIKSNPSFSGDSRRYSDDFEGGGGYLPRLRSRRQFIHRQAGHI